MPSRKSILNKNDFPFFSSFKKNKKLINKYSSYGYILSLDFTLFCPSFDAGLYSF